MECATINPEKWIVHKRPHYPSNVIDRHNSLQLPLLACLLSISIMSLINEREGNMLLVGRKCMLFCKGMRGSSFYATHNTFNNVLHRTGAAKSRLVAESKCWPDLDFCYKWHGVFDGREEPGIAKKQPEFKKWEELALQGGDTGLADLLLHGRRGGALPTNRHQVHKYTWTFSTS